jgi:hypothetical protein
MPRHAEPLVSVNPFLQQASEIKKFAFNFFRTPHQASVMIVSRICLSVRARAYFFFFAFLAVGLTDRRFVAVAPS